MCELEPPLGSRPLTNLQLVTKQSLTASSDNPGVLDPEVYGYLRETLAPGALAGIYSEFLERTRERLAVLMSADSIGLHEFAHTAGGTAGMLGAREFASAVAPLARMEPGSPELEHLVHLLSAACDTLENVLLRTQVHP